MATTNETSDPMPEWLDRSFVAAILSREEGRSVDVKQLRVARAVAKGDNAISLLLRVGVDYDFQDTSGEVPKTTSLIVKSLPMGEAIREFVIEFSILPREAKMYSTTLPALEAILNEKSAEKVVFAPEPLHCEREHTIVLQDLRELGYRMCNRHVGMDLVHASTVLRNLARFHAASVALHHQRPQAVEGYTDVCYQKRETLEVYMPQHLECVAQEVESWGGQQFAEYAEKIRHFAQTAIDQIMEAVKPSKISLNVLNHGDCHVNNCLFRYDEESGKLEEMRFVDFQMVRYTSPTLDLQYFLYTSVQADVREAQWSALLDVYATQLRDTLTALGHGDKAVTVPQLEADMDRHASYGIVSALLILCGMLSDPDDGINPEELTKKAFEEGATTASMKKSVSGKRYRAALQQLLPMFVKRNVL